MNDDPLPLSRLFLHLQYKTKDDSESRRQSIEPIQEDDGETEEYGTYSSYTTTRQKERISMVAKFSMKFHKMTGMKEFRRSKDEPK